MADRTALRSATLLAGALALAATEPGTEPAKVGVEESVRIQLVQLEVTVRPEDGSAEACTSLTAEDFELHAGRREVPIVAVDSVAADEEVYKVEGPATEDAPSPGGMSLVLFFDLWHLDVMASARTIYKNRDIPLFPACPRTKGLAFREARRYVEEAFHEGDRLLLVTSAGWPVIHYGWIRTKEEALRALARLAKDRQVASPRREHLHHKEWIAGMESFFLALGRYPGRKDVLYLADDFRFDDVAMRFNEIVASAQASGVVVSAVDLLDVCRAVPGLPCAAALPDTWGLGCTEFRNPVVLNAIARDTGGRMFSGERITTAVEELRATRRCRYVVSFSADFVKGKKLPRIQVRLRGNRKGLTLDAPSSFQPPQRAPTRAQRDEALFLLPRFGRGIAAEVAVWPYRAAARKGRWDVYAMARVEHTDDEPWPDGLTTLTVQAILRTRSKIHGAYRKTIAGDELAALRAAGGSKQMLFPIEDVPPGDTTVDLTITADAPEVSANVRKGFTLPELPAAGEARPWFLSDRSVRLDGRIVRAPSLDGAVQGGDVFGILGYGCRPKGGAPSGAGTLTGKLVPLAGGASVPVTFQWIGTSEAIGGPPAPAEASAPAQATGSAARSRPAAAAGACGWLFAPVGTPLAPGLWTFDPPGALGAQADEVEFSVLPGRDDGVGSPDLAVRP